MGLRIICRSIPKLTIELSAKFISKVFPAGTVNDSMLTTSHATASSMSSREAMVPVQGDEEALGPGAARQKGKRVTMDRPNEKDFMRIISGSAPGPWQGFMGHDDAA